MSITNAELMDQLKSELLHQYKELQFCPLLAQADELYNVQCRIYIWLNCHPLEVAIKNLEQLNEHH